MISIVFDSKTESGSIFIKDKIIYTSRELGGVESLMSVPYFMTHADVPKDVKADMDLVPELLRLAVGIEHIDDLLDDVKQALK